MSYGRYLYLRILWLSGRILDYVKNLLDILIKYIVLDTSLDIPSRLLDTMSPRSVYNITDISVLCTQDTD